MKPENRPSALDHPLVPRVMRALSRANVWVYRKTGGRLGDRWRGGSAFPWGLPILLLTTLGKKSGQRRTAPLLFIEDEGAESPVTTMTHHVFHVSGTEDKRKLVHHLASGTGRRILFLRTKHQAKKLAKQLTEAGVPSVDLHGNLSQPARDRNLAAFSSGQARVLVATDIAARGVHVDDVELVVHVDPPAEHKAYLHRSGRTARAGSAGDVVTLVLPEQRKDAAALLRRAGINAKPQEVSADSAQVQALIGERAPYQAPAAKPVQPVKAQGPKRTPTPRSGGQPRRGGGRRGSRGQARSGSSRAART